MHTFTLHPGNILYINLLSLHGYVLNYEFLNALLHDLQAANDPIAPARGIPREDIEVLINPDLILCNVGTLVMWT